MPKLIKADPVITDRMMDECKARMAEAPGAWGCTVLLTTRGNLYSEIIPQLEDGQGCEERLVAQLSQVGDTEVEYALCWPIIVPSWRIRTWLPELDPRNQETRVLTPQEGDPRYSLLREFQPPQK